MPPNDYPIHIVQSHPLLFHIDAYYFNLTFLEIKIEEYCFPENS